MVADLKSFRGRAKRIGLFSQIVVNGSFEIPTKSRSSPGSYLNAADNSQELLFFSFLDHFVYL